MPITDFDTLIAKLREAQRQQIRKASRSTGASDYYHSLWTAAGNPGAGAAPAALNGVIRTNAAVGALRLVNPAAGQESRYGRAFARLAQPGVLVLCDRLWDCSGYLGNDTALKAIAQPPLSRYTDGIGVECFLETYTAIGTNVVDVEVRYRNSSGVGNRQGFVRLGGASVVGRMYPMELQAGDVGIQAIESLQVLATTGGAGDFGLTLLRRLSELPIARAGDGDVWDVFKLGYPKIENSACLSLMLIPGATLSGEIIASADVVQG